LSSLLEHLENDSAMIVFWEFEREKEIQWKC